MHFAIIDGTNELAFVESSYDDFNNLKDCVHDEMESGKFGSRFPTLLC